MTTASAHAPTDKAQLGAATPILCKTYRITQNMRKSAVKLHTLPKGRSKRGKGLERWYTTVGTRQTGTNMTH